MSILKENEHCCFICVKTFLNQLYNSCFDCDGDKLQLRFRPDFFEIRTPFLMKNNAIRIAKNITEEKGEKSFKKRKRCKGRLDHTENLSKVDEFVSASAISLVEEAMRMGYLENTLASSNDWLQNNQVAQTAAKGVPSVSTHFQKQSFSFYNSSDFSIVKTIGDCDYVFPAKSKCHLCDIQNVLNLEDEKYDLIVLDPPWQNKSVRRKKKYATLNNEMLRNLQLKKFCSFGCLIVVWTTNNKQQISYVINELFPLWNISEYTIWHWAKVTLKGRFIHPIESHHKKPYENLILGYVSSENNGISKKVLPPQKVIVSVPSSIHSHKPPLVEVLKPYIPENPKCLELFARYLLPGWTSVGNEVLKLQNIKLFKTNLDINNANRQ